MLVFYCVDTSGSMGWELVDRARAFVRQEARAKDVVVLFDDQARVLTPQEAAAFCAGATGLYPVGHGGTRVEPCLEAVAGHAAGREHRTVLVTDGYVLPEDARRFDAVVEVGT